MSEESGLRVHLGCGARHFPGFVHIDVEPHDHLDHQRDIADLAPLADDSAELIYACHCFNCFDDEKAVAALHEWRRVLRPGGTLRLSVPDLEAIARAYLFFRDVRLVKRLITGFYQGKNQVHWYYNVYDEASLRALLEECGYTDVALYDWRETEHARYDDYSQAYLPHMDKESGLLMSVNMEARKPAS